MLKEKRYLLSENFFSLFFLNHTKIPHPYFINQHQKTIDMKNEAAKKVIRERERERERKNAHQ